MDDESSDASGRFLLRIDSGLHTALREAAREAGLSLNQYCAAKLALPCGNISDESVKVVRRAASLFGGTLAGVVAFGSWTRGQETITSDIDLMIVVDESVEIGRHLYRAWDQVPIHWNDHVVEAHFVHPPRSGERISGMWAEVATDGVVLFERGLAISMRLVEIREEIAAGRLIRRRVHGQPYWVERQPEYDSAEA